ncbi:DUF1653 domain-containing protein [[Clostridium] polysaccharolyticum]|jgi:hypothetical protein|uniref:DUF1653 domain-containing protein n=1 Tax=[Clostridium] polysaccharolyticum TaxID=29364 RepID=A0A1I0DXD9_9FIRM|nr:DUF1653 domain-containing protein [[Clostridium] polysaccharolyticum]SET37339.1 Protein of unknown function [[Clostridium] polysaccharolyticum]
METRQIPKPGEFYRHFKMKYYQIIAVATHSETREQMVVYQALYEDFGIYVRPLDMFLSETDHDKYPDVAQKYRFERVNKPCAAAESLERTEPEHPAASQEPEQKASAQMDDIEVKEERTSKEREQVMDLEVERFLDADTYKAKLDILMSLRNDITDKQLHDMAAVLDVIMEDGTVDDKFLSLVNCLRTMARFEVNR